MHAFINTVRCGDISTQATHLSKNDFCFASLFHGTHLILKNAARFTEQNRKSYTTYRLLKPFALCRTSCCGPDDADRPPDCNLQSLLKHQTDVRAGFASLDLVQDQRRWAYVQSSAAFIYQNRNQPDAVGLIRLIFHQRPRCQTLRQRKLSDTLPKVFRQLEFEFLDSSANKS